MRAPRVVIAPVSSGRRDQLVSAGAIVAKRYTCEAILPQWQAFLAARRLTAVELP